RRICLTSSRDHFVDDSAAVLQHRPSVRRMPTDNRISSVCNKSRGASIGALSERLRKLKEAVLERTGLCTRCAPEEGTGSHGRLHVDPSQRRSPAPRSGRARRAGTYHPAALLAHIAEVDARKLYLPAGSPSTHPSCVH